MLNLILTEEVGKGQQKVVGGKVGLESKRSGLSLSVWDLGEVTEPFSVTNGTCFLLRKLVDNNDVLPPRLLQGFNKRMQVKGTALGAGAMLTDRSASLYPSFYTNTARQLPFTEHLPGTVLISGFQSKPRIDFVSVLFNSLLPRLSEKTPPTEGLV